jgi:hypothetical protein
MAELNFGLLNPPGSQSIGNAFVQGMDQAAAARAQENQNAMAQYTLGKAKREDLQQNELYNAVRQPGFKLDIGTAMRFGAPGLAAFKAQEEAATRGIDFQIKQKTLAGLPNKQLLDESNLLDKVLDRFKGQVPNIQTPEAVAEYVRQTYADPILGPYGAKLKPLDQALADNLAEFNANPDKWRTLHTNVSGLQILQATMPKPQVAGGNIVNMNPVSGQVGAPIAGAPAIPQAPVAKLLADIAAAKARNAPPAEIAALEREAGRLDKLANIAGGQLSVAQGNLALNKARLELQQNAPKLGLVDPEDIDRVAVAMASGRVPVDRLNSTTAPMFAKLLKANPDLDFTNMAIEQAGAKARYIQSGRIEVRQTLTDEDATRAENIARGNLPPATGINADKIMNAVIKINPEYNARDYGLQTAAEKEFNIGKNGNKTRSLNVAVSHLTTLNTAAAALRALDVRAFNEFKQAWQRETGKSAPTDFNAVRELVADEIVAAVVPGVGALADRKALKDTILAKSSPEQLQGAVKYYKELLGGQLGGLEKQYNASTRKTDFRQRYLTPEAIAALTTAPSTPPAGAAPTATTPPPAGVDAALWNVMTADERKLWQK